MTTRTCTCPPVRYGVCPACAWWDALFTASQEGVLGADRARMFREPDPPINLRALLRRVALVERAVGLGRLSELV